MKKILYLLILTLAISCELEVKDKEKQTTNSTIADNKEKYQFTIITQKDKDNTMELIKVIENRLNDSINQLNNKLEVERELISIIRATKVPQSSTNLIDVTTILNNLARYISPVVEGASQGLVQFLNELGTNLNFPELPKFTRSFITKGIKSSIIKGGTCSEATFEDDDTITFSEKNCNSIKLKKYYTGAKLTDGFYVEEKTGDLKIVQNYQIVTVPNETLKRYGLNIPKVDNFAIKKPFSFNGYQDFQVIPIPRGGHYPSGSVYLDKDNVLTVGTDLTDGYIGTKENPPRTLKESEIIWGDGVTYEYPPDPNSISTLGYNPSGLPFTTYTVDSKQTDMEITPIMPQPNASTTHSIFAPPLMPPVITGIEVTTTRPDPSRYGGGSEHYRSDTEGVGYSVSQNNNISKNTQGDDAQASSLPIITPITIDPPQLETPHALPACKNGLTPQQKELETQVRKVRGETPPQWLDFCTFDQNTLKDALKDSGLDLDKLSK